MGLSRAFSMLRTATLRAACLATAAACLVATTRHGLFEECLLLVVCQLRKTFVEFLEFVCNLDVLLCSLICETTGRHKAGIVFRVIHMFHCTDKIFLLSRKVKSNCRANIALMIASHGTVIRSTCPGLSAIMSLRAFTGFGSAPFEKSLTIKLLGFSDHLFYLSMSLSNMIFTSESACVRVVKERDSSSRGEIRMGSKPIAHTSFFVRL